MLHGAGDSVFRFHFSTSKDVDRYTYFLKFAFGAAHLVTDCSGRIPLLYIYFLGSA